MLPAMVYGSIVNDKGPQLWGEGQGGQLQRGSSEDPGPARDTD